MSIRRIYQYFIYILYIFFLSSSSSRDDDDDDDDGMMAISTMFMYIMPLAVFIIVIGGRDASIILWLLYMVMVIF